MKRGKKILSIILALSLAFGVLSSGITALAAGGNGTADNPYEIGTYAELKAFANIVNSGNTNACAILTNDIIATDATWTPIGNNDSYYKGRFDGRGCTVTGISMADNASYDNYSGMFGYVGSDGTVCNLCVKNGSFKGATFVGLIGLNYGTVKNCVNNSDIDSNDDFVGGIAGENDGTIERCLYSGTVTSTGYDVGGIAGYNYGTISSCCNYGNVTAGANNAGGIAGENDGTVINCYNTGCVTAQKYSGGIVGYNGSAVSKASKCYSTGCISADSFVGGIAGKSEGYLTSCYYDSDVSGVAGAVNSEDIDTAKGLTTAEMQGAYALMNLAGLSVSDWAVRDDDYPVLIWQSTPEEDNPDDPDAGLVWNEDGGVYEISDYAGLRRFAAIVNGESVIERDQFACAVLTADITAGSEKWTPIGNEDLSYIGTFDGGGHTVTGLTTVNDLASDCSGMFGCVGTGGTVCNLNIEGGRLSGSNYVGLIGKNYGTVSNCNSSATVIASGNSAGGIAGCNEGTIECCSVYGAVTAYGSNAGGIAGLNYGTVSFACSSAAVNAKYYAGGIAGYSNDTITKCYNTGSIRANMYCGGIAGQNYSANSRISVCYNAGTVWANSERGGIAGSSTGYVTNCYYDSDISVVSGAVNSGDIGTAKGLTTAEMQGTDALMNLAGFSGYEWTVRENDYPVLYWQLSYEEDNPDDPDAGLVWNENDSRYEISDYAGLRRFAAIVNGESVIERDQFACAVLTADITAGSEKWTPIGSNDSPYAGTFDGGGHTVTGLTTVRDLASDYSGMFGRVGSSGTVCNLNIESGSFTGGNYVGLTGKNSGTIRNCTVSAVVTASNSCAGGIAGYNEGVIECCANDGAVTAYGNSAGGISGENYGSISSCCNYAAVNTKNCAGGIAGYIAGTVTNCYNTGSVSAQLYGGGIVGQIYSAVSRVSKCYNTGSVSANSYRGGIAGSSNGYVTNCYYDKAVSGVSGAVNYNDSGTAKGLTTAEMQGADALMNLPGFSGFDWTARDNDYPVLAWQSSSEEDNPDDPDAGLVWNENDDCYEISDYAGLRRFAAIVNGESVIEQNRSANAVLTADITAGPEKWTPIGSDNSPYTGTFDGNGHTVTGLTTVRDLATDYSGMFGRVGAAGTVCNLYIESGSLTGGSYVGLIGKNSGTVRNCVNKADVTASGSYAGGIAGRNEGTIECCESYSIVTISGSDAGGIAGNNNGTISSCCNYASISAKNDAGGIAGFNSGTVTNCYNTGSVSANMYCGGIAGTNSSGVSKVTKCFNTGVISSNSYEGGIAGSNSGYVTYSYYDKDVSGVSGAVNFNDAGTAKGLTTAEMQGMNALENLAGFSSDDWAVKENDYPVLVWQASEITAGAHSLTIEGDIAVNFYIDLGDYTDSAYAQFTVDGETFTVPADFDAFASVDGKTLYKFTCNVAPVQIDSPITCSVYNGRIRSEEFTYSVNSYFDEITADETLSGDELLVKLAGSMACYGYFANLLFNYNPAYMFNDIALNVNDRLMTVSASDIEGCAEQMEDTADGVIYYGSSLLLRTRTAVRHYFTLPEDSSIDDFTFLLAGDEGEAELTPVASGNLYYIEIDNIPAPELGDFLEVYVTDGSGSVVNSWLYSAMSYARKALIKYEQDDISVSPALANAVKALVVYYECASDYFDANAPEEQEENSFLLINNFAWGTAYLYALDENENELSGEWPGTEITDSIVDLGNGETAFRCVVPEGAAAVIISCNGSDRTERITDFDVPGYWMDGTENDEGEYLVTAFYF